MNALTELKEDWIKGDKNMPIIIIKDVDPKLLEEQRLIIGYAVNDINRISTKDGSIILNSEEVDALMGISNMLDAWSDESYWKKHLK